MELRKCNWDFAKAVLMFLVIFGHVCPALTGESYREQWCALTRISGLFVMPLFFFISGCFQSVITSRKDIFQKYRKTIFRIGIPLMSWGVLLIISHILFIKESIFEIANFYWFFSALIMCVLFGTLVSWTLNKCPKYGFIVLFISLPLFTISKIDIFHFTFVWFYYGCGMIFRCIEAKLKVVVDRTIMMWIIILASVACVVIGYRFYPQYTFYMTSNLINETSISFLLFRYILCLAASICVLYWIFKLYGRYEKKTIVSYLTKSGQETLFIYCSHVLIISCFLKSIVERCYGANGLLHDMSIIRYYVVSPLIAVTFYYLLYSLANYLKRHYIFKVLLMGLPTKLPQKTHADSREYR